jgi:uncharacterized damage-inducible protein DinB
MLGAIRTLYAYSAWANRRILDTAERLPLKQFIATDDDPASIRDILVHTASAQANWIERCRGNSPRGRLNAASFPYVSTLRSRWAEIEDKTTQYLAGIDEADLARIITYVNDKGETWSYPLWQALLHQANHATQHRSEAAQLLTRYGHSPGDLDFLVYVDMFAPGSGDGGGPMQETIVTG